MVLAALLLLATFGHDVVGDNPPPEDWRDGGASAEAVGAAAAGAPAASGGVDIVGGPDATSAARVGVTFRGGRGGVGGAGKDIGFE